jgi:hypothetical protein
MNKSTMHRGEPLLDSILMTKSPVAPDSFWVSSKLVFNRFRDMYLDGQTVLGLGEQIGIMQREHLFVERENAETACMVRIVPHVVKTKWLIRNRQAGSSQVTRLLLGSGRFPKESVSRS